MRPTRNRLLAILLLLSAPASARWDIVEKPGELRVANGKIGVVLTSEANQAAVITLMTTDNPQSHTNST